MMPSPLDLLTACLGPLRIDQEKQLPMLVRLITACCSGADSDFTAVSAVLMVLDSKREDLELDFPRWSELQAACAVVTCRQWQRVQNTRIVEAAESRVA